MYICHIHILLESAVKVVSILKVVSDFFWKIIDKIIKPLKTDRNTFFTYILTLLTVYILVDRILEVLFLIFTGTSFSYWGPIQYTLALACPIFAFLFSFSSKFVTSKKMKLSFFFTYVVALYIIAMSMFTQWLNLFIWTFLLSIPNYAELALNFSNLFLPALSMLALYIPLTTFYPLFKWLYTGVNDTKLLTDSIQDYGGINLAPGPKNVGAFTCEVFLCNNDDNGKKAVIPEVSRFHQTLVIGPSGSGKTSLVFEPLIARDKEKKFFFSQVAKEMGYTALKTGIATLRSPYTNDYMNKHFSLDMLLPAPGKTKTYESYMSKLILSSSEDPCVYKDLGVTFMAPDYEAISHMINVANNFSMSYNLIDPNNSESVGLNPFIYDDPVKIGLVITTVLKNLYVPSKNDSINAFKEKLAEQAVQNLCILLKVMYPRLNNGDLPNLEDLLQYLLDFNLVEKMCKEMEEDPELAKRYKMQIAYFKKSFYSDGSWRSDTEASILPITSAIEGLLRHSGVKDILCNRENNLNYDDVLKNGDLVFVCTRRGDLGATIHKSFGLFFILLMQFSVLSRPGNENTRIPHFLYIDEFSDFICDSTEPIFTLYRKYRVGAIISAQNLAQLTGESKSNKHKQTILANCTNKIIFGGNTPEDNEWLSQELGEKREWKFGNTYDTSKGSYDSKLSGISWSWKKNYAPGKVQSTKFKVCLYKIRNNSGKLTYGKGKLDFLESKYKEPKKIKKYNFDKFTSNVAEDSVTSSTLNKKDFRKIKHFADNTTKEIDPIQTDYQDTKFLLESEDAIVYNLNNKKGKK